MATISRAKTWTSGETLTAANLNSEFDNILSGINSNSLDPSNLSTSGTYTFAEVIVGSGITSADGNQLHVHTASAGSISASADADEIVVENSGNTGITLLAGTTSNAAIYFGDSGDNDIGKIDYDHNSNTLALTVNTAEVISFTSANTVFNDPGNDVDFRIETNNIANGFVVDGGLDVFSFGAAAADDKFVTISPPAATHTADTDTYALHVTAGGAQTIPSGTTALVASVAVEEPNITATGTVTSAASLYVKSAPTEGGSNYALWVDDGAVKFDAALTVGTDVTVGDDLLLNSDSAVLSLGAGADATLTHDGTTGVTIAANPITITSATAATWSTSAGALTVNGAGGINLQEGGATIIGISDSRALSTTNTASVDLDASGAIQINSSGGALSIGNDNVDQNVNLATAGTRTLNIGILDGTDTTTITSKGNQTHSGTITVGVDNTGYDVKLFGDTSGAYLLWDESADDLKLVGAAGLTVAGTSALTVTTASTITASGIVKTDNGTDATSTTDGSLQTDGGLSVVKDAIFGNDVKLLSDSAVLALGDGSDATLTHDGTTGLTIAANPITITSAGAATWSTSSGALSLTSAAALNVTPASGSAIVLDGTINVDAGVVTGATSITSTAFVGDITGDVTGDISGNAATFTATANNSTDETVYPVFVDGATGSQGAETDTGLTYNPSTGALTTATILPPSGDLGLGHASKPFRVYTDGTYVGMRSGSALNSSGEGSVYVGSNAVYMYAGTVATFQSQSGSVVFNEGGVDVDFRIEGASEANLFYVDANVDRIGIGTASPDATLTLDQGSADTAILTFKSSDVGHAITDNAQADTYGAFYKSDAAAGGMLMRGLRDADAGGARALILDAQLGEAAETSDSTGSEGVMLFTSSVISGNATTAVADAGNAFAFRCTATRLIIKGDGALHATNITGGQLDGTALDGEDDIGLIRTYERTVHQDAGIAMSKWDAQVESHEEDLRRVGVLVGDFYCQQRMNSLLGGGIWQTHVRVKELEETLTETRMELQEARKEIKQLAA